MVAKINKKAESTKTFGYFLFLYNPIGQNEGLMTKRMPCSEAVGRLR